MPTIGTSLLIGSGPDALVNRKVLAHPAMVFIGLISYPLYLWHWPILTFARIMNSGTPSFGVRIALVGLTFVLAWMTYQFAERPVRFGKRTSKTSATLAALVAAMVAVGLVMKLSNGFASIAGRYNVLISDLQSSTAQMGYRPCATALNQTSPTLDYCLQSSDVPPTAALYGDSHADHLFPGIVQADPQRGWLLVGNSACPPVSAIYVRSEIPDCQRRSEKIINYLQENKAINIVVLSFFANFFLDTDYAADHLEKPDGPSKVKITSVEVPGYNKFDMTYYGLNKAVSQLEGSGKQIVIVIDVPELPFFPESCIKRPLTGSIGREDCSISRSSVLDRQAPFRVLLKKLQLFHPHLRVYDSLNALCTAAECLVESEGVMRYRDSHHLSVRGSELVGKDFIGWLYNR